MLNTIVLTNSNFNREAIIQMYKDVKPFTSLKERGMCLDFFQ